MTQITPIKGFNSTLVTRSIILVSTVVPILLSIINVKYMVILSLDPFLNQFHQFWRILTFQMSVINESDYLFVVILFWYFKPLERFYGSHKYLLIISILFLYNAIITVLFMWFGQLALQFLAEVIKRVLFGNTVGDFDIKWLNEIISGPLPLISSLYICYMKFIPVSYEFVIELTNPFSKANNEETIHANSKNIILTNHFPIQIIYTLLFINNGVKSFVPCLIGLTIGKLYLYDLLPKAKSWSLPSSLFKLFTNPFTLLSSVHIPFFSRHTYQQIPQSENPILIEQDDMDDQDDISNNLQNQIRAETPIRPLTGQFLDTFRN